MASAMMKVTSRGPAACAAWLEQTASLPCATQHTLRAFWMSCRVRGIDQSILKGPRTFRASLAQSSPPSVLSGHFSLRFGASRYWPHL